MASADELGNTSTDRHASQRQPSGEQEAPYLPIAASAIPIHSQIAQNDTPLTSLTYSFVPPPPPPPIPSNPNRHVQSPSQSISPPPPPPPLVPHSRTRSTSVSPSHHQQLGSAASSLTPSTDPLPNRLSIVPSGVSYTPQPTSPNPHHPLPAPYLPSSPSPPTMPSVPLSYNQHLSNFSTHIYQTPLHRQPTQFQSQFSPQTQQNTIAADTSSLSASFRLVALSPPPPPNLSFPYPQTPLSSTSKPLPIPNPATRLPLFLSPGPPITTLHLGHLAASMPPMTALPILSSPPTNFVSVVDKRTPSPFDLGPFPASSIPKHFPSKTVQTPPPRPPKPPELAVASEDNQTSTPSKYIGDTNNPQRRRDETLIERDRDNEVVRASMLSNSYSTSIPGGEVPTSSATHAMNALTYGAGDEMALQRQGNDGPENEFSEDHGVRRRSSVGMYGSYNESVESGHSVYATVEGGPEEDTRSDFGGTMESYNPAAFDFPRNVNDAMAHVLSPTRTTDNQGAAGNSISLTTYDNESTPIVPGPIPTNSIPSDQGFIILPPVDGEAPPPTYDQVASEMIHEREREQEQGDRVEMERTSLDVSRVLSPPPEFRPLTPGGSAHGHGAAPTRAIPSLPIDLLTGPSSVQRPRVNISRSPSPVTFSHPSILTSPPTPEPHSSPKHQKRRSMNRRFTMSSYSGRDSPTISDESTDPFQEPTSFQTGASPFAAPSNSEESMGVRTSTTTERGAYSRVEIDRAEMSRNRSSSGIYTSPTTPRSETTSDDVHKWIGEGSGSPMTNVDTIRAPKGKRLSTPTGSRMSMFFRGSNQGSRPTTPTTPVSFGTMRQDSWETGEVTGTSVGGAKEVRSSGRGVNMLSGGRSVDLLDDAAVRDPRDYSTSSGSPEIGFGRISISGSTGGDREELSALNIDLWEGVEFGRGAPKWNTSPQPGPLSNPSDWRDDITLYPLGSNPFFIRAPTWRSLLRFLASQSNTRIEPSVEALATSRTPTIDLRLVVQFARNPHAPKDTTRDICLYMCLHTEMPALGTKLGRTLMPDDRVMLESWDTRALPYGFICQESGLLSRPAKKKSSTALTRNLSSAPVKPLSTPINEQDPDGEDSAFVSLPPPFIELPVNLSNVAMYLHECLVMSRRNGKIHQDANSKSQNRNSLGSTRIKKPMASTPNLPIDTTNTVPANPDEQPTYSHTQMSNQKNIPGIKRLAKAVKTFYPDEYAIGSSKANHAAELAAIDEGANIGGKALNVPNSSTPGGSGKGGFFSAFQRVKSKSAVAKQAASSLGGGGGPGFLGGRDANAERYELVTPWRQ